MRKTDGTQDTLLSIQKRRRVPGQRPSVSICEGALQPQQFRKAGEAGVPRRWQAESGTWVQINRVPDPSYSDIDNPPETPQGPAKPYFG